MSKVKEVPVFLFTGFLESGKTKFIQETLEDKTRLNSGERTLLIVCEEGEEEYAPHEFSAAERFHGKCRGAVRAYTRQSAQVARRARLREMRHRIQRHVDARRSVSGAARDVDGVSGVFLRRCAQHPQPQRQYCATSFTISSKAREADGFQPL